MTFMPHLGQRLIAGRLLAPALGLMALPQGALAAPPCGRAGAPVEAKALAEKAVAHPADVELGKAFNHFMSPSGAFMPTIFIPSSSTARAECGSMAGSRS